MIPARQELFDPELFRHQPHYRQQYQRNSPIGPQAVSQATNVTRHGLIHAL
jgi:hypothetical protein